MLSVTWPDQFHNLPWHGVSAEGPLGEHQGVALRDLEHPAGGLDQAYLRVGERLPELGRQTGGPGLIVSDDAEFDGDLHVPVSVAERGAVTPARSALKVTAPD
jgi:hypothetical protein